MKMSYKNNIISTKNEFRTSPFGRRVFQGQTEQHDGVDIVDAGRLERAQEVWSVAVADGVVNDVHNGVLIGHGVDILHAGNILSRQYHFKTRSVLKVGDKVKKGDCIGILGTTGRSTGIHLHFGIKENSTRWNNGSFADPEPYLRGEKIIGGGSGEISGGAPEAPRPTGNGTSASTATANIKPGDKVRVINVDKNGRSVTYTGGNFKVWHSLYDVIQVSGDRIVIGIGKNVTAAVNKKDLAKV